MAGMIIGMPVADTIGTDILIIGITTTMVITAGEDGDIIILP